MKMKLNPNKLPKITTLSDNAKVVLDKRYIIKDKEGNPLETHEQLFYRIAKAVAEVEKDYVDADKVDIDRLMIDFYHLMTNMEFLPNSPTIFNAGTPNGQLSACFVLPIHDSMESIFTTLKHAALIHKSGGGTGFDFSELRPKDSTVGSTGGAASGPLSFLKVYDAATEQVKAAGKRRGANMGVLRVDHPDIVDFIKAKEIDGVYSNFNLSVAITDKFMEAVKNGTTYELIDPHTKEVTDTPDARSIYELIVDRAWLSGDPGIIFIDTMNKHNPIPKQGNIASTNPCVTADNWVDTDKGPVQVKDLIGVPFNAVVHGKVYSSTEEGFFYKGKQRVYTLTSQDEKYRVRLTKDHKVECMHRGGVIKMTPADKIPNDAFIMTRDKDERVLFGSLVDTGVDEDVYDCTIDEIHKFSCNGIVVSNCAEQPLLPYEACNLGSINLAKMVTGRKEILIDWAKLKETVHKAVHFLDNVIDASVFPIPEITEKVKQNRKIGLGVMGWADLLFLLEIPYDSQRALMLANDVMAFIRREAMAKSKLLATYKRPFPGYEESVYKEKGEGPYRNATVTTVAPTGTLSMIAGCSSGIEPIFALYFVKHVMNGERLAELNPYFMNALKKSKCDDKEVMDAVMSCGSVRSVDGVPDEIKEVFGTAMDISPEYHLRMQAAFQEHIDSAVSKTVNLPHEATREDIDYIYRHAHEWGCKGVTVYRDGCKSVQVLYTGTGDSKATGETKEVSVDTTAHVIDPNVGIKPMARPEELTGFTRSLRTGYGELYLTVNEYEGRPFEVFATIGRSGRSITAKAEAIGRLVSLALRSGIHVRDIVKQLKGIGGEHPVFQKKGMVLSIPDAVGIVLEQKYLKGEPVVPTGNGNSLVKPQCPDCGDELVFQEGCLLCPNCAYSKCG